MLCLPMYVGLSFRHCFSV